uniref:Uncharacterized protein n=1 Tax=Anguilla anguilla TaxID=7936 RepID=A0A0E9VXX1_ANGAN
MFSALFLCRWFRTNFLTTSQRFVLGTEIFECTHSGSYSPLRECACFFAVG